jgi:DNA-nicking Smr family endonuclease
MAQIVPMSGEKTAPPVPRYPRRHLTAEEEHLWSVVAHTVEPLRHGRKARTAPAARAIKKRPVSTLAAPPVAPPHPRPLAPAQPAAIGRREKQALARGRTAIDARIDLHGMTQTEAHGALLRFLHRAQAGGGKFVLVITGKGSPVASRADRGILRRQVPLWLGLPEFRACVFGFAVADIGHGGDGALFVRLRRVRG